MYLEASAMFILHESKRGDGCVGVARAKREREVDGGCNPRGLEEQPPERGKPAARSRV